MHGHFAVNKTAHMQEKNQMESPKLLVALDKAVDLVVIGGVPYLPHVVSALSLGSEDKN